MTKNSQIVRVVCTVPGFEKYWIEYDVSSWNLGVFVHVHKQLSIAQAVTDFIPEYSTNWHVENEDGTVIMHPGPKANEEAWLTVWQSFDVHTSRKLNTWLWVSILLALTEANALDSKSATTDPGDGAGVQDAA